MLGQDYKSDQEQIDKENVPLNNDKRATSDQNVNIFLYILFKILKILIFYYFLR